MWGWIDAANNAAHEYKSDTKQLQQEEQETQ